MNSTKISIIAVLSFYLIGCQDVGFELTEEKIKSLKVGTVTLAINYGAQFTNDKNVRLLLQADNADEVFITNDKSCSKGGEWKPFIEETAWTLKGSNNKQEVYAKFRNSSGFNSPCISDDIIHDDIAPVVKFSTHPNQLENKNYANFTYEIQEELSGIGSMECQSQSNKNIQSCSPSGSFLNNLPDGIKHHSVIAIDRAGNSSHPIQYEWTIDTTAPTITLRSHPAWLTNKNSSHFEFAATDHHKVKDILCSLKSKLNLESCESLMTFQNLKEGEHRLYFQAIDMAGNKSQVHRFIWAVDQSPPIVEWLKVPNKQTKNQISRFKYSAKDNLSSTTFLCKIGSGRYASCRSNTNLKLPEGQFSFSVIAKDEAGNRSTPLKYQWLIDRTPPQLTVHSLPDGITNKERGLLSWTIVDDGVGTKNTLCKLNGQPWPCNDQFKKWLDKPSVGAKTLVIKTQDQLGNRSLFKLNWNIRQALSPQTQYLNIENHGETDVLFVVDNSMSMSAEQAKMAKRFKNFLVHLNDLDWQIGITTTDSESASGHADGKLAEFKNSGGLRVLDSSLDFSIANKYFQNTIRRKEWGSSLERGIHGAYRAIERISTNRPNADLFREKSHLSIVVISDEDESHVDNTDTPEGLINLVNSNWGAEKSFQFHSIIVRPGDVACLTSDQAYGYTYHKLSQLTGGIVGNICADDYAQQLSTIGQQIRDLLKRLELYCAPYDSNRDGIPDVVVEFDKNSPPIPYQVQGKFLIFDEPVPIGQHKVSYHCVDN